MGIEVDDMITKMDAAKVEAAINQTTLRDFVGMLVDPVAIDAIVPGPALIDGEPVEEGHCAIVLRNRKVVTLLDRECAMPIYHAAKRGCIR